MMGSTTSSASTLPPYKLPPPATFGILIGIAPGGVKAYSSHYNTASKEDYPKWSSYKLYTDDGHYTGHKYQCVEFARRWLIETNKMTFDDVWMAFQILKLKSFKSVVDKSDVDVERTENGKKGHLPVLGTVMLWNPRGFFFMTGHVAIVTHVRDGKIGIAEQNVTHAAWGEGKNHARELDYSVDPETGAITIVDECFAPTYNAKVLGWVTPKAFLSRPAVATSNPSASDPLVKSSL